MQAHLEATSTNVSRLGNKKFGLFLNLTQICQAKLYVRQFGARDSPNFGCEFVNSRFRTFELLTRGFVFSTS